MSDPKEQVRIRLTPEQKAQVKGATDTSQAFMQSLQSALNQLRK